MGLSVKICGINNQEALAATLSAQADMAGFVHFARSPRHINLSQAKVLGLAAAGKIAKVALTVNASDDELGDFIAALRPDLLQLHGQESAERIAQIKQNFGLPVMKAIGVSGVQDLRSERWAGADHVLFDAKPSATDERPGGNGIVFDWSLLSGHSIDRPWLLSGGLRLDNVAEAIAATGCQGIDVSSGVEAAPGVKDAQTIIRFTQAARQAYQAVCLERKS